MAPSHLFKNKALMLLLKTHDHCSTGGGEEIEIDPLPKLLARGFVQPAEANYR
jgi:hypothetical protein